MMIDSKVRCNCQLTLCKLAILVALLVISLMAGSCNRKQKSNGHKPLDSDPVDVHIVDTFTIRYRPQWLHQAQFAGIYMASKKGFYRDYGLDVEIQDGGPEDPAYESIQKGTTDMTQLFLLTALNRGAEKNNLINLAQISQKSALMLVAKRNKGINKIADLNGKKLGLWRSDFRDLSLIFVNQHKLNMEIINVDWTINLFLNDVIDVMNVMRYNEYHQLIQSGIDKEDLFVIPFSDVGLNIIEDGLYCTKDFYEQYPDQCRKFAEATIDGWMYAINHQEETIDEVLDIMRRHYIPANRAHQAWMLEVMKEVILAHPRNIGKLQKADFEKAKELLLKQGSACTTVNYNEFTPHAY